MCTANAKAIEYQILLYYKLNIWLLTCYISMKFVYISSNLFELEGKLGNKNSFYIVYSFMLSN